MFYQYTYVPITIATLFVAVFPYLTWSPSPAIIQYYVTVIVDKNVVRALLFMGYAPTMLQMHPQIQLHV